MRKVIVAGHICLDITPVFHTEKKFGCLEEILIPGQLIQMDKADVHTGGAVANTGLAFKKLGADVTLLGKVGDDDFGKLVTEIAQSYGAGGLIVDGNCSTSYSVVIAVPGTDRVFLHHPGANDTFLCEDIPDSALEGAELFHFGYPPLMKSMYENEGEELLKIVKRVHDRGIPVSLDMASVDPNCAVGAVNWRNIVGKVAPYLDFFVPSLDEIQYMLGEKSAEELADELFGMGVKTILIKCGEDGLYYKSGEAEGHQPAIKAPFVASATGAGDTCIAAFLMAMLEGKDIKKASALAAAEGSCCVTAYDAISGLKTLEELEKMIG